MNSYLNFNKEELVNLEYSLKRELLATNRAGGYASTTIVNCNTRKYHGLLVLPLDHFSGENHVLLSTLDETIIQKGCEFHLGIHQYSDTYQPRGHKYIVDLQCDPIFSMTYRVGAAVLKKEFILVHNEPQLMIRYTLVDAYTQTALRLNPFLAFRNIHALCVANDVADTTCTAADNGVSCCLYSGFPRLYMQLSKPAEFVYDPNWYYGIQYAEEQIRGYDYQEDLMVPGYFEFPIAKGESVVFSACIEEVESEGLLPKFSSLIGKCAGRYNFRECLEYSAAQFIAKNGKSVEIAAGYPWFGRWGRDTFIALPGITLASDHPDTETCRAVLDTMSSEMFQGMFPNIGKGENAAYNSADAPMWYFWALQQYCRTRERNGRKKARVAVWKHYGEKMKEVLDACRGQLNEGLYMKENALLWSGLPGRAMTWMDAVVEGVPVTPRAGYVVEINALWYNALCFCLELATAAEDTAFITQWETVVKQVADSFVDVFWIKEEDYLADYVDEQGQNREVRPNQMFACSLEFSPLNDRMKEKVMAKVRMELMTAKGIRTLSPGSLYYKGQYEGNQRSRDLAYHQGTVWPWLIGSFIEANLKLYGKQFVPVARELIGAYEEDILYHGISSVSEVYSGDSPHAPNGSPFQAWSVAEVLRSLKLIENYDKQE